MTLNDEDRAVSIPRFQRRHRLALALEAADVSVAEMAAELGVSRNTVGNYLSGRTTPSRAVLRVWALRCGFPMAWIEDGREEDPPDIGADTIGYRAPVYELFNSVAR